MYDGYGRFGGTTHDCEGFSRAGFNRGGVNPGGYDIGGHYGGCQLGHGGVDVLDDGWVVTPPRVPASGVHVSRTRVLSEGQRGTSSRGSASGTVRTETLVDMAGEANMVSL